MSYTRIQSPIQRPCSYRRQDLWQRHPWAPVCLTLLVLGAAGPVTPAQAAGPRADPELERCRVLRVRIEHYTRLRRGGGNNAQMERWRRARRKYEGEYREKRCHRFGSRLRRVR